MASIDPTLETLAPNKLRHLTGAIRRPRATTAATIEQIQHQSQLLATRPEFMQFCFDNTPSEQEHSASSSVTVKL
jgi:hypothetical protein